MFVRLALLFCLMASLACFASVQTARGVKSAVLVLIDEPELRIDLETRPRIWLPPVPFGWIKKSQTETKVSIAWRT